MGETPTDKAEHKIKTKGQLRLSFFAPFFADLAVKWGMQPCGGESGAEIPVKEGEGKGKNIKMKSEVGERVGEAAPEP